MDWRATPILCESTREQQPKNEKERKTKDPGSRKRTSRKELRSGSRRVRTNKEKAHLLGSDLVGAVHNEKGGLTHDLG